MELFSLSKSLDPSLELKYNKFYIGLATNGQPNNFVVFKPRKHGITVDVKLRQSAEVDQLFEQGGVFARRHGQTPECDVQGNPDIPPVVRGSLRDHRFVYHKYCDIIESS
jgi:hypothetical protein